MAYVQRALSKTKAPKKVIRIEEMKSAQATIFRLLQQQQFAEEMKSLKIEEEVSKKVSFFIYIFFDKRDLFVRKAEYEKKSIGLQCKASNFNTLQTSRCRVILA